MSETKQFVKKNDVYVFYEMPPCLTFDLTWLFSINWNPQYPPLFAQGGEQEGKTTNPVSDVFTLISIKYTN